MKSPVAGEFCVLISVYYKVEAPYLERALQSIWSDQVLKPLQICLIKDGKLTASLDDVVEKWKERLGNILTIVETGEHVGLAKALNLGIDFCRYELIARMDADDESLPLRFYHQYLYMQNHPEIDVVGGQVEEWNDGMTEFISIRNVPLTHEKIFEQAKVRSPMNHPTVMYRKNQVLKVGKYPIYYPEDYPLWGLMLQAGCKFENLDQVLVKMRVGQAFRFRRGFHFLIGEIQGIDFLRLKGFLTNNEAIKSISARVIFRFLPNYLKLRIRKYYLKG